MLIEEVRPQHIVVSLMRKKVYTLPNSRQWTSNELTFTYKLYYGILLGVNFDIQTVLLNL